MNLPPFKPNPALIAAGMIAGIALAMMYAWLPYASGYGSERVTVFHFANYIWGGEAGDWQHCYLVPVAVIALIIYERKRFATIPISGSWFGLAALIFGLLIYWVGFRADNIYLGYASFQVLVAALILWILGWQWMVGLAFCWFLLVFLYPLPFMDNFVAFPLREVMSKASVDVLNFIGVPTIQSGTAILSASDATSGIPVGKRFSVDVADPCSGIRSLFALMMVSAIYGYLTQKELWKKGVIFLCSMPLAVLGNLTRILMLTIGTIAVGPAIAIGTDEHPSFFHEAAGYVVFVVALGGMLGVGALLNTNWRTLWQKLHAEFRKPLESRESSGGLPVASGKKQLSSQDEY